MHQARCGTDREPLVVRGALPVGAARADRGTGPARRLLRRPLRGWRRRNRLLHRRSGNTMSAVTSVPETTKRRATRSRGARQPFLVSPGSAGEARLRQLLGAALEADAEGLGLLCLLPDHGAGVRV